MTPGDDLFSPELVDDGDTPLTPEEQRDLIPSISTRAQLNEIEQLNIHSARLWAMRPRALARPDLLSDGFGRELHRRMFNQVWRWAGKYRTTERNLGWEVHRIAEGVRNAFDDAHSQLLHTSYPLHEVAVRLHHRLVAIHPWPNGNGRHSRLVADIVVAARSGEPLTWGAGANLVAAGEIRARYLAAVRAADRQDFGPLLNFARS
jgi:Fic-DOC domain mobile mystery protein B